MLRISKRTPDVRQKHQHELSFLHLFRLCTGSIPLLSWSMRAVKQPSPPALHHAPVTSPVGSSRLLICCLELANGGLASVKPLNDKIQVLSSLSPRFSTRTNGLFCLRHGHCCWQTHRHPWTWVREYTLSDSGLGENMPRGYTPTQARRLCPLPPPLPPSETQKMYDLSAAWRLLLRTPTIPGVCNKWYVYCGKEHSGMAHSDGLQGGYPRNSSQTVLQRQKRSGHPLLNWPYPYRGHILIGRQIGCFTRFWFSVF